MEISLDLIITCVVNLRTFCVTNMLTWNMSIPQHIFQLSYIVLISIHTQYLIG